MANTLLNSNMVAHLFLGKFLPMLATIRQGRESLYVREDSGRSGFRVGDIVHLRTTPKYDPIMIRDIAPTAFPVVLSEQIWVKDENVSHQDLALPPGDFSLRCLTQPVLDFADNLRNVWPEKQNMVVGELPLPAGVDAAAMAVDEDEGISIRYVRAYNVVNNRMLSRFDMLGGWHKERAFAAKSGGKASAIPPDIAEAVATLENQKLDWQKKLERMRQRASSEPNP